MDHNNHINTVKNQPKNENKKAERNRIKKKYKLKIKQRKTAKTPKSAKPKLSSNPNNGWKWFTLKSQQLSLRQKKPLFQAHNLYRIKEHNSGLIFQLQCHLHAIYFTKIKTAPSLPQPLHPQTRHQPACKRTSPLYTPATSH